MRNKQTGNRTLKEAKRVITNGHPPMADKIVLVDFDATLFPFGFLFDYPEPLPGAIEALKILQNAGYKIWIFTSRLSPKWLESVGQTALAHEVYILDILSKYGISVEGVTAEKFPAEAYVDDKAYRFENNWDEVVKKIIDGQ
jgi:hypothetical protein